MNAKKFATQDPLTSLYRMEINVGIVWHNSISKSKILNPFVDNAQINANPLESATSVMTIRIAHAIVAIMSADHATVPTELSA